jgi:hypothetical protein
VTSFGLDDLCLIHGNGIEFLIAISSRPALNSDSYAVNTEGFSTGIKRPGMEADRSLPSGVNIKSAWRYISTQTYVFIVRYWIKQNKNLPLHFISIAC